MVGVLLAGGSDKRYIFFPSVRYGYAMELENMDGTRELWDLLVLEQIL